MATYDANSLPNSRQQPPANYSNDSANSLTQHFYDSSTNSHTFPQQSVQQPLLPPGQLHYPFPSSHPLVPMASYQYLLNQHMYDQQFLAQQQGQQGQQAMTQRITNVASLPSMTHPPPLASSFIGVAINQQQSDSSSIQPRLNNLGETSTPNNTNKRDRGDVSGNSEQDLQIQANHQYRTRVITNQSKSAAKRQRPDGRLTHDNQLVQKLNFDPPTTENSNNNNGRTVQMNQLDGNLVPSTRNQTGISNQAQRFATTRYPFSPFIVHLKEDIRDKLVIEHLIKHAKEQCNGFDLCIMGYRRTQTNASNGEYDVLVFVENTRSFVFLMDTSNWPVKLVGKDFTRKMPSIPPQLSAIIQNVGFNISWDEFVQDIKENHPQVVNVIRLKNRNLKDLKMVKVEFNSDTDRNVFLDRKYVHALHMRFPVVEYLALAQVLICSRCMHIGHFQKNCPQKDEVTCKTCGTKCADIKEHDCQGVPNCVRCGGDHKSSDSKCPMVKDYRAALTRTLLARKNSQTTQPVINNLNLNASNFPPLPAMFPGNMVTTHNNSFDMNQTIQTFKEIMLEEGKKTRESFEQFKEEMSKRDNEHKQEISKLNTRISVVENQLAEQQKNCSQLQVAQQDIMTVIASILQAMKLGMKKVNDSACDLTFERICSSYNIDTRDLKLCSSKT